MAANYQTFDFFYQSTDVQYIVFDEVACSHEGKKFAEKITFWTPFAKQKVFLLFSNPKQIKSLVSSGIVAPHDDGIK